MNNELMTFGEFLGYILKKKHISISEFAIRTNTKSRNSIQRLLKDESSIDVIQKYYTELTDFDSLYLTPYEEKQLAESIEVSKYGKDALYSRKIILNIFNNVYQPVSTLSCKKVYGKGFSIPYTQLFEDYVKFSYVKILIFNASYTELTNAIVNFIHKSKNSKISIDQFVVMSNNAIENANTFVSMYKLFSYTNYKAYYCTSSDLENLSYNVLSTPSNFLVVYKESSNGKKSTDLIRFNNEMEFSLLTNTIDDSLYNFYADYFEEAKLNCKAVRKDFDGTDFIDSLIKISEYLQNLEHSTAEYLIKQNMCFQMLDADISYKMLKDANFFGLNEDHPKIQKLIQIAYDRFHNYYNSDKMKVQCFTKRGLSDFVKNRIISDHLFCFRPLTKEEIKYTLSFMLKQIEDNKYFKIYLLNDDYFIGNIELCYFENSVIYFIDSSSGYGSDYDEGIITAKPIVNIFDDFIKNEVIKNHTLPIDETEIFLKELLASLNT